MQMEEQTVQTQIRRLLDPVLEQSDLGLRCLPRPLSPKILGHYGSYIQNQYVKRICSSFQLYIFLNVHKNWQFSNEKLWYCLGFFFKYRGLVLVRTVWSIRL